MVIVMKWLCIIASIIWGSNVVLMKALLNHTAPFLMAFYRVLFSALVIYILLKFKHISLKITRQQILPLMILGLLNVALNFSLSFIGMEMISGTNTAMLNALSPVVVWLLNKKKENSLGILLTVLGILVALHFRLNQLTLGHLLLIASIFCYVISFIYAKKIALEPLVTTFYALLFGGVMLLGVNIYQGSLAFLNFTALEWLLFITISVIGFAFIQSVYFIGSRKIGMEKISYYMNLNPFFTYIGTLLFLKEPFDMWQLVGFILILMGLVF